MKEPSLTTIKRLFALSNNTCAFPKCNARIIAESGTVTGKLCHIKAKKPSGPRYDPKQSDAARNAASNLILLCAQHHDIIDKEPHIYTGDILQEMKEAHEKKGRKEILPEDSFFADKLLNDYRMISQLTVNINQPTDGVHFSGPAHIVGDVVGRGQIKK
jgi:hypothetical protein